MFSVSLLPLCEISDKTYNCMFLLLFPLDSLVLRGHEQFYGQFLNGIVFYSGSGQYQIQVCIISVLFSDFHVHKYCKRIKAFNLNNLRHLQWIVKYPTTTSYFFFLPTKLFLVNFAFDIFWSKSCFIYVLEAKFNPSTDIPDARRLQTQTYVNFADICLTCFKIQYRISRKSSTDSGILRKLANVENVFRAWTKSLKRTKLYFDD